MSLRWRLLDTGANNGAFNMSFDREEFYACVTADDFEPLLRFYRFAQPTITYGYSQKKAPPKKPPIKECAARITGGGMVYHIYDFTYSVIAAKHHHPAFASVRESYHAIHEWVRQAFEKMGHSAKFHEAPEPDRFHEQCFLAPVKDDLLYQGKKIAGAAQKRSKGVFLHQGTVDLEPFLEGDARKYPILHEQFKKEFLRVFETNF